jgi:hypothetical protein
MTVYGDRARVVARIPGLSQSPVFLGGLEACLNERAGPAQAGVAPLSARGGVRRARCRDLRDIIR